MEQYHDSINNNPNRKKTAIESKIYPRFITTIAIPAVLLILTLIAAAPVSPVQATVGGGGDNETAATPAPGGASLGPTANETNVTAAQSACLPQNATTTGRPAAVDAGGAATTTTDNTTTTVAPGGASIGGNETSTSPAAAENATTNNTTATVAPSGASIC
ncbi:MAG: hypothetical protein M3M86_07615 [Thermoproteota archaeon]|nr:hypothetical protein [Thermoproteota archaeon]